jgi:ribose-phosphate pyrophosphokinase
VVPPHSVVAGSSNSGAGYAGSGSGAVALGRGAHPATSSGADLGPFPPQAGAGHRPTPGVELGEANLREFANGEIYCKYDISIRGCDVFIIQTHSGPVNDSLMEHLIMIDAAKRASAKRITAVCPYYGYSRQDRKSTGREPITAKLVADMFSAAGRRPGDQRRPAFGADPGFLQHPVRPPGGDPRARGYMRDNLRGDVVVVAPDAGRVKVAERYSQHLGFDLALVHKTRPRGTHNEVKARHVVGDVEGGTAC